jgi:hypothetical protein
MVTIHEIIYVRVHVSTQLCDLYSPLLPLSPVHPPPPHEQVRVWVYVCIQCVSGGASGR